MDGKLIAAFIVLWLSVFIIATATLSALKIFGVI